MGGSSGSSCRRSSSSSRRRRRRRRRSRSRSRSHRNTLSRLLFRGAKIMFGVILE